MVDHLDSVDGARRVRGVAEVAELEVDPVRDVGEVLPATGRQVVDHTNLVTERQQAVDDVRADEAGAPGDEAARWVTGQGCSEATVYWVQSERRCGSHPGVPSFGPEAPPG